jgi:hypothetical protein
VATDLPVSHASNELIPGSFQTLAEGHTRLSGVVQELIIANPEGGIPGFPVCPTLESRCGHVVCVTEVTIGWMEEVWGNGGQLVNWSGSRPVCINEAPELSPPQVHFHQHAQCECGSQDADAGR